MVRTRLVVLAALVPLASAFACTSGSSNMGVLSWDTPDASTGTDEGLDTSAGSDTHRDVAPWDPGQDAWPADVAIDPSGDESPTEGTVDDLVLGDPAGDEGKPDSTVEDTAGDPSPADVAFDAKPDPGQDIATDTPRDTPPDAGPGTLTCSQILDCANACSYTLSCVQDCIRQGDPAAQGEAQVLLDCTLNACSQYLQDNQALQNCVIQNCRQEGLDCLNGTCQPSCAGKECGTDGCGGDCGTCGGGSTCSNGACVTGPGQTCLEIANCALACGSDYTCIQNCESAGSSAAQGAFQNLFDCLLQNCMQALQNPTQLMTCVQQNCPTEYADCQAT